MTTAIWRFPAQTDLEEAEHRVERIAGRLYCTCRGFVTHRHCKHIQEVKAMNSETTHDVAVIDHSTLPQVHRSPADLAVRLAEMKEERSLVQQFFADVMEEGQDYGVIPGTDKPTLFKPGAEKLCELYGYAPTIRDQRESIDNETGFYRCVITIALVHKGTGLVVAEGIGECNTREARYFYRWVGESKLPSGIQKSALKSEQRQYTDKKTGQKRSFTSYRLENDDLHSLWNTITKMAKKRALVDATLSATRSSGIFTQGMEEIHDWIEAEYTDVTEAKPEVQAPAKPAPPKPAEPRPEPTTGTCEHEPFFDEKSTLMTCRKCGLVLEEPAGAPTQSAMKV